MAERTSADGCARYPAPCRAAAVARRVASCATSGIAEISRSITKSVSGSAVVIPGDVATSATAVDMNPTVTVETVNPTGIGRSAMPTMSPLAAVVRISPVAAVVAITAKLAVDGDPGGRMPSCVCSGLPPKTARKLGS